ncbi:MAG: glycosyltransferase family 87 protein [Chloroflexota bacterium]
MYLAFALSDRLVDLRLRLPHVRRWGARGSPARAPTRAWSPKPICGIFQYPPPFLVLSAPFTLLLPDAANWVWVAMLTACVPLAVLAMPVPPFTRLVVMALLGTSWPTLFAIRVGAVGPLLLLLFALGWRWVDRPGRLAAVTVLGGFIKLMPGLMIGWMLLTRRWRAAFIAIAGAAVVGGAWLLVQPDLWLGFLTVEREIATKVIDAPSNFSPAALAHFGGLSAGSAQLVGLVHAVALAGIAIAAALRRSAGASFIAAAIATQAIAPVLWDHYAIVVFLAVAWLLARRQWWAALLGIAMNWMLILWFQPWQWIALMDAAIVAVVVVDWLDARRVPAVPAPAPQAAAA